MSVTISNTVLGLYQLTGLINHLTAKRSHTLGVWSRYIIHIVGIKYNFFKMKDWDILTRVKGQRGRQVSQPRVLIANHLLQH